MFLYIFQEKAPFDLFFCNKKNVNSCKIFSKQQKKFNESWKSRQIFFKLIYEFGFHPFGIPFFLTCRSFLIFIIFLWFLLIFDQIMLPFNELLWWLEFVEIFFLQAFLNRWKKIILILKFSFFEFSFKFKTQPTFIKSQFTAPR